MEKSEFVGVNGCRSGWFSVGFDSRGCDELKVFPAFSELLAYYRNARLVLVDIPIGLQKGPGGRQCDQEARNTLRSPRSSSVFSAPIRQTVEQAAESPGDYDCANVTELRFAGKRISKQAFSIAPKIAQVDELLKCRDQNAIPKIREIHPEICFWDLDNGNPMQCGKKSKSGEQSDLRSLIGLNDGVARYTARLVVDLLGVALRRTTYSMRLRRQ